MKKMAHWRGILFLVVLVSATLFGANWIYQRAALRRVDAEIQRVGAVVQRDAAGHVEQINIWPAQAMDADLDLLGRLPRLRMLNLQNTGATDEHLRRIVEVAGTRLRELYLSTTRVTDAGCEHLARIQYLESVFVEDTAIRADGLRILRAAHPQVKLQYNSLEVAGLNELRKRRGKGQLDESFQLVAVDLSGTDVGDDDVLPLASQSGLKMLNLSRTRITDATLRALSKLQLDELWLTATNITDEGMKAIGAMTSLKALSVAQTQIHDGGIAELVALQRLERLVLESTAVTDAGLEALARLGTLRELHLKETQFSDEGVATLGKQLPQAKLFGQHDRSKPVAEIETHVYG